MHTPDRLGQVDVVLPAGGRLSDAFAREAGVQIKALIDLDGRTILRRTVHALRATGRVRHIAVIGPDAALTEAQASGADALLPEGASGPENMLHGLEWARTQGGAEQTSRALIAATDLPFLTAEAIVAFLDACPPHADIVVPVVRAADFETQYPNSSSVYVNLRDGEVTLGCAFLVNPATVLRNRAHLERAFAARKSNLAMAQLLGPVFIAKYLARRLTVADIEHRCQRLLNCVGAAIPGAPVELAYDIDLPEEYAYARTHLLRQKETVL